MAVEKSTLNKTRKIRTDVALRRVRANTAELEKEYYIFWACVCSLRYPACNAHALYCHMWPVWLYRICPHYIINGAIFERKKNGIEHKMCVWISLQLLSEKFLIVRRTERDMVKNVNRYSRKLSVKLNSVALVRERTIPTERPPPVGKVRANFCG